MLQCRNQVGHELVRGRDLFADRLTTAKLLPLPRKILKCRNQVGHELVHGRDLFADRLTTAKLLLLPRQMLKCCNQVDHKLVLSRDSFADRLTAAKLLLLPRTMLKCCVQVDHKLSPNTPNLSPICRLEVFRCCSSGFEILILGSLESGLPPEPWLVVLALLNENITFMDQEREGLSNRFGFPSGIIR